MHALLSVVFAGLVLSPLVAQPVPAAPDAPIPDIRQLMKDAEAHQKQLDKIQENYTYSSVETTQEMDDKGQVKKTTTVEQENFFVNGHLIQRTVKKDGKPLSDQEQKKETDRVTKLVEKAGKTPRDQPLEGQAVTISRLLEIMDVRNPRRQSYHGRSTILFDFSGRKDAKTHGMAENLFKKFQGTLWIDESDRQIARLEVYFNDNFHVGGGLVANIQKGSRFSFDQGKVNGEIWFPTGGEGTVQARILLLKNLRAHFTLRDFDFKRFHVEAEQTKETKVLEQKH